MDKKYHISFGHVSNVDHVLNFFRSDKRVLNDFVLTILRGMESKLLLRNNPENHSCDSLHVSVVWFGFFSFPFRSVRFGLRWPRFMWL